MTRLLRLSEVMHRTGLRRSTLYALVASGEFPKPIKLAERASAWVETEVETWIQDKITSQRQ